MVLILAGESPCCSRSRLALSGMASAFALPYSHKPVRQEGFHLPSPPPSTDTPPPQPHDPHSPGGPNGGGGGGLFGGMGHGGFHAGDFNDELASLINPQSNERSTQSPTHDGYGGGGGKGGGGGGGEYTVNGEYRPPPHNIFDISAPGAHHHHHAHHAGSASSTSSSFPAHFSLPSSSSASNGNNGNNNNNGSNGNNNGGGGGSPGGLGDGAPPYHFNSTLPALNSSMRYDPHPHGVAYMPSPSSFRSPSPHHGSSRSRSRSRPPSSHLSTPAGGPTRTTRARRNGSLSSTSPPPGAAQHGRPVPQAIVIPGSHGQGARGSPYWFGVNGEFPPSADSLPSLTSLPSLPSLNSLNSPHLAHHQQHHPQQQHHMGGQQQHMGSPHHMGGGGMQHMYNGNGSYPSPVEAKFGGLALGVGGMALGLGIGIGPNHSHSHHSPNPNLNGGGGGGGGNGNGGGNGGGANGIGLPGSLGSVSGAGANGTPSEKGDSKASLLAHEKRRRRRESHNAVERRRRDNINEKISELATLIPECLLDGGAQTSAAGASPGSADDALLSPTAGGAGAGDWPLVLPGAKKEAVDDEGKDGKEGAVVKANKGMILRKSVEYIRYLQQLVTAQGARNRELEEQLKGFRGSSAGSASPPPGGAPPFDAGVWALASMPEGDDEGLGIGMDVDAGEREETKRGRRAKREEGAGMGGEKRKGKKAKGEESGEGDEGALGMEDESELSEDGMDV
ncbi:helix-loop-helix DNA-binding domain-containing protein [Mycena belliarum]|uniref:Helix-loop-helix DNA-binding domain-containing protein n=1 Tax=Mycena belliarum TaxID=1033014 RepID=A0AAD6UAL6_9AGAR|nr:helix-loop-helix DNA-binding domain-containing protein [Mycena belliae]